MAAVFLILASLVVPGLDAQPTSGRTVTIGQLNPESPESYLVAAEDLMTVPNTRLLRRQILAVGAIVGAEQDPVAASSCLIALADSGLQPSDARWLWALAIELHPDRANEWRWVASGRLRDSDRFQRAARMLGLLRVGNPDAIELTSDAALIAAVLDQGENLGHRRDRVRAIIESWRRSLERDPCAGRLYELRGNGQRAQRVSCSDPTHHYWTQSGEEWQMMAGIELALLEVEPTGWHTADYLMLRYALPLPRLKDLEDRFGVSALRPFYRDGAWQSTRR